MKATCPLCNGRVVVMKEKNDGHRIVRHNVSIVIQRAGQSEKTLGALCPFSGQEFEELSLVVS